MERTRSFLQKKRYWQKIIPTKYRRLLVRASNSPINSLLPKILYCNAYTKMPRNWGGSAFMTKHILILRITTKICNCRKLVQIINNTIWAPLLWWTRCIRRRIRIASRCPRSATLATRLLTRTCACSIPAAKCLTARSRTSRYARKAFFKVHRC